jgi:phosphomannomutase
MHGVGYPFIQATFHAFGLPPPIPVPLQAPPPAPPPPRALPPTQALQVEPDPTFPTVKLPNPEEGAGALQLAFQTAEEFGAKIVVANDPDADRFVFAELQHGGKWRVFNGNEIGLMYAPSTVGSVTFCCFSCFIGVRLFL